MLSMELKGNVNLFCHDHHQSSITEMDIKDFPAISNLLIIDLYIDTTYPSFVFGQLSFSFYLQYLMIGMSSIHMLQVNFCLLTFSTLL